MVLKVEEDEDDLLALLFKEMKYARVRHNCKERLDRDTVSGHSIAEATETNGKVQEDNPIVTSMPRPPISISPDSIELRLSLLMGIPMEGIEEDENNHHEALNESLTGILNQSVENNENAQASNGEYQHQIVDDAIKIQDSFSGPCYNPGQEETAERIDLPDNINALPTNKATDGKIITNRYQSIGKEFPCEEFKNQGITLKDVNRFKDYLELVEELVS